MIINTGQRTDIPAFYPKWFMNRIREGYVLVRNPYYPTLVTKFLLTPDVVDVIGFCTKNPRPMFPYLDELKPFGQFWYVSITGFEKDLEPNVPSINQAIEDFKYLSEKVGKNAIGWRYTPIIVNEKYTVKRHIETFKSIAKQLEGYTTLSVFGFVDLYDKLKRNHPEIKDCSDEDKIYIAKEFSKIAKEHHMDLRLCSKEKWLRDYGIDVEGCMRIEDYERSINSKLKIKQKMQARKGYCACYLSNDIGTYNSCLHLCTYCYANGNKNTVMNNYKMHDDNSPFLIGHLQPNDKIKEANQESYKIPISFDLFQNLDS
ncbi:MAG: DUF1848 domain-containing protein [Anaeroplasmataceae bacterium]|nr:DUF1848 domain-containing protein [Anaeroplasmataceae bacterium]